MLSRVSHMTILSAVICVLSEGNVTTRASLFTDQRMSSVPILTKYKHFKTICEHTLDSSPAVSSSSFLKLWSSQHGIETLHNCSLSLFYLVFCFFNLLSDMGVVAHVPETAALS